MEIALLRHFNVTRFFSGVEDYWITDPGVSTSLVLAATITLVIAGTLAGYIPAKRAASIKPIVALRDE